MNTNNIADTVGVSQKTVQNWIRRFQEEGSLQTKARSGRPRVTTPEVDRLILNTIRNNPLTSVQQHCRDLELACHSNTVRRRAQEAGINCHIPATKEKLTQHHKECRLGFALQYLNSDYSFWEKVIFTDEKYFTSIEARKRQCWRISNTR